MSESDLRELARADWLVGRNGVVLHAPSDQILYFDEESVAMGVTYVCGRFADWASIPGLGDRLHLPRCARCCDRTGIPRGVGSPKNDPECRERLGL